MKQPSIFAHIRDIILLPFTVTFIVPYLIFDPAQHFIPDLLILKIAGAIILAGGAILFFSTILLFHKIGKGTLAPWQPTQKLVIKGPYRYCRNPMISGVFFILTGESLILHSTSILIWAGIFFTINTVYFILIEEPSLLERFGDEYSAYKAHVPRWIPRMTPYQGEQS